MWISEALSWIQKKDVAFSLEMNLTHSYVLKTFLVTAYRKVNETLCGSYQLGDQQSESFYVYIISPCMKLKVYLKS